MSKKSKFKEKYGPWAFIAGGSSGLGGGWTKGLAERGLNVIFTGRNQETLDAKAEECRKLGVEAIPLKLDMAADDYLEVIEEVTKDKEVGMLVYNAGYADLRPILSQSIEHEDYRIKINVRGPMTLSMYFGKKMKERGKGGIVLMASGAGLIGNPYNIGYSASKAYDIRLAEGLWYELKQYGIDVTCCISGMVKSHDNIGDDTSMPGASKPMEPSEVVDRTLKVLGKRATMAPGFGNQFTTFLLRRIMPTTYGLEYMGNLYETLFPDDIAE